jgi:tetratricopeptide (TPR) repeat protein
MNKNLKTTLTSIAFVSLLPTLAQAQFFKDPTLEVLSKAKNYAELERVAAARIATNPLDTQAILASAVVALRGGNKPEDLQRRKTSIANAELCISKQPDSAICHYALGSVLGVQAMNEGMIKMAGSVGKIKESLSQAVVLDGTWFPARSALISFYMMAPGVVGGSKTKAQEVARSAPPDQAKALEAFVLISDEKNEAALQMLNAIKPSNDSHVNEEVASWTFGAAIGLVNNGKAELARSTFERLARERPTEPNGLWGLARVNAEAGQHTQAIQMFNNLASLKGTEQYPIDYRLGISYQALGQKEQAKAAFTKFVAAAKGSKKSLDDASARLEALKN